MLSNRPALSPSYCALASPPWPPADPPSSTRHHLPILLEPLFALFSTVVTFQKQRGMSQSDCPLSWPAPSSSYFFPHSLSSDMCSSDHSIESATYRVALSCLLGPLPWPTPVAYGILSCVARCCARCPTRASTSYCRPQRLRSPSSHTFTFY